VPDCDHGRRQRGDVLLSAFADRDGIASAYGQCSPAANDAAACNEPLARCGREQWVSRSLKGSAISTSPAAIGQGCHMGRSWRVCCETLY
jgi:hypothetical protein